LRSHYWRGIRPGIRPGISLCPDSRAGLLPASRAGTGRPIRKGARGKLFGKGSKASRRRGPNCIFIQYERRPTCISIQCSALRRKEAPGRGRESRSERDNRHPPHSDGPCPVIEYNYPIELRPILKPEDCPKFEPCHAPICPLDPDWQDRHMIRSEAICRYIKYALRGSYTCTYPEHWDLEVVGAILDKHPHISTRI